MGRANYTSANCHQVLEKAPQTRSFQMWWHLSATKSWEVNTQPRRHLNRDAPTNKCWHILTSALLMQKSMHTKWNCRSKTSSVAKLSVQKDWQTISTKTSRHTLWSQIQTHATGSWKEVRYQRHFWMNSLCHWLGMEDRQMQMDFRLTTMLASYFKILTTTVV